ncbi:response regulator, partial [Arcobacteraceae bacterium]|nr:response regulator [Arcobacteraceae bacterium]
MKKSYLKIANILYVEDEDGVRDGYAKALKRCSKELYTASDGKIGLDIFKTHSIDIVVTDIKMPNMNGIDMVKEILKISNDTKIVFTTAHGETQFLFEAIEMQVDGYLLKPVPSKKLLEIIEKISKNLLLEEVNKEHQICLINSEKMLAMETLIENISHQWRQPLSVISTATSGLKFSIKMGNEITQEQLFFCVDKVMNQTDYLAKVLD